MAPHAETARQVQGVHGLRLKLPKHGPTHGLQLLVQLLTELGEGARRTVTEDLRWGEVAEALCSALYIGLQWLYVCVAPLHLR